MEGFLFDVQSPEAKLCARGEAIAYRGTEYSQTNEVEL